MRKFFSVREEQAESSMKIDFTTQKNKLVKVFAKSASFEKGSISI